ncbi:aminopeptidase N [Sphingomonas sp.]|uniref:aminopeptidase N n=1 Tax=Sphingomonas sp. TaxID=28214 RepID=UPI003AFFF1F4
MDNPAAVARPHTPVHRGDYRPPAWLVPAVRLDVDLDPRATRVRARLDVRRNADPLAPPEPLRLDGAPGMRPTLVAVDGVELDAGEWRIDDDRLVIPLIGAEHVIDTEVMIDPGSNTQLMGLYASSGLLCTQCEAEGFRRITFFPDRPDVLATYTVRMTADAARYPVLLANGDKVGEGVEEGRHWAEWHDPFPKPCYLFAMVAGDLAANRDSFTTMSGRTVQLGIWVREADLPRTGHAMAALKASMAWDERVYGREYDLGIFNIVAVSDFNFGAMENKGLNIFNSRYILADPETATDADYDAIAGVVAHEYFHNWSGNRVTCRDWFQLSLKEGFTVYRDQQFSGDQGSRAVKRIEDVRVLRAAQFPEDAGPLAHPIRPDSYLEISNFYTATIYNKGAEVIGMLHTMLGDEGFRAGCDRYFKDHDGTAATCEDFVRAMEEANGADLTQFRLWYTQAGTPRVRASVRHDPDTATARVELRQTVPPTPGQPEKRPMPVPLRLALFGRASAAAIVPDRVHLLDDAIGEIVIDGVTEPPVLSINRGFSAPVTIETDRTPADLAFLSAHDDDPFARSEAMQQLMVDTLIAAINGRSPDEAPLIDAIARTLTDAELDPAFVGETVLLPSEAFLGDQLAVVDPAAVRAAREGLRRRIATTLDAEWRAAYQAACDNGFSLSPEAKGRRRLRTVALGYIAAAGANDAAGIALRQFEAADNMTDRFGALGVLASGTSAERETALAQFHDCYRADPLVLDKWFSAQALSMRETALDEAIALSAHADFTLANPNRLRALVGCLAANQYAFHAPDGRGYRFVADMVLAADRLNPQSSARLVPPLGRWRRFEPGRSALMRMELERLAAAPGLSKDAFEQVTRSLG